MSLYNTHTHIFNVPSVPNAFLANYNVPTWLGNLLRHLLRNKPIRKSVLFLARILPLKFSAIQLKRYAALLDISLHRSQAEVFQILGENYPSHARFVALTMNFDYMTGEVPMRNYNHYDTQLHEVLQVKELYGEKILPFLFIDPRMGERECMELLHRYFNPHQPRGLVGIKLYPSLGYYPFHPNLKPVYEFASEYTIPIITHAYKNGGALYTGRFTPNMMSYHSFNPTTASQDFINTHLTPFDPRKLGRYFANILLHPVLFTDVLESFPKLKICFAHFGGDEEIVNQHGKDPYNWTNAIKKHMGTYENVYTDISYALAYPEVNKQLELDMKHTVYGSRILFGTDFFLSSIKDTDRNLVTAFFKNMKPYEQLLTETNPRAFLKSSIYTPA